MKRTVLALAVASLTFVAASVLAAPPSSTQSVVVANTSANPVPVTASTALPVTANITNAITSPVPVAVVNGSAAQSVSVWLPIFGNTTPSATSLLYTNTGTRAVALYTLGMFSSGDCEDAKPVAGMFQLTQEGPFPLTSRIGAPIVETPYGVGQCAYTMTLPQGFVVGPGSNVKATVFWNQAAPASSSIEASISGQTLP